MAKIASCDIMDVKRLKEWIIAATLSRADGNIIHPLSNNTLDLESRVLLTMTRYLVPALLHYWDVTRSSIS